MRWKKTQLKGMTKKVICSHWQLEISRTCQNGRKREHMWKMWGSFLQVCLLYSEEHSTDFNS